jgi:ABC-type lipoprotein release transport system permease subunit
VSPTPWYNLFVPHDSKINSTRVKKSILASKRVKVWFWDTVREYTGEAVALSATDLTTLLKMGGTGMATVIPSQSVMDGLIKHLTRRVVEFKISGMSLEVNLKGTIHEVQKDFENPKRLLLLAKFQATSDRTQMMLNRLGQNLGG